MKKERLGFIGSLTLGASVALAACGGDKTPATQTPVLPTETPNPTLVFTPEPTITPSPTPEPTITPSPTPEPTITPSPTPEITPMPIQSIIESKPIAVSKTTLNNAAEKAYESPALQGQTDLINGFKNNLNLSCEANNSVYLNERKAGCTFVLDESYQTYLNSNNQDVLTFFKYTYDFSIGPQGPYYNHKSELDSYLKSTFPQS